MDVEEGAEEGGQRRPSSNEPSSVAERLVFPLLVVAPVCDSWMIRPNQRTTTLRMTAALADSG